MGRRAGLAAFVTFFATAGCVIWWLLSSNVGFISRVPEPFVKSPVALPEDSQLDPDPVPFRLIPADHTALSDATVELVRAAILRRAEATRPDARDLAESRKALDVLSRVPLIDPHEVRRIQLRQGADWFVLGWQDAEKRISLDDVDVPPETQARIEEIDFGAELDEVTALIDGWSRGERTGTKSPILGWTRLDSSQVDDAVRYALWASRVGRVDDARTLLDGTLAEHPGAIADFVTTEARRWYLRGARLLEAGAPRADVLAVWRRTIEFSGPTQQDPALRDLVATLDEQVTRESRPVAVPHVSPESLSADGRARRWIERFVDVRGEVIMSPGDAVVVGVGEGTRASDEVVEIGRDAVPALLNALEDRRLTRTVHRGDLDVMLSRVIRVGDVALTCLRRFDGDGLVPFARAISWTTPQERKADAEKIRAWWRNADAQPKYAQMLATLRVGDVDVLRQIEELAQGAVDALQILRNWVSQVKGDRFVHVAIELERRGDAALIPDVVRMVHEAGSRPNWTAVSYVLEHGSLEDIRRLIVRVRQDRMTRGRAGDGRFYPGVPSQATYVQRSAMVPVLLEGLRDRSMSGSRHVASVKASREFGVADTSIEALIRLTGHDAGYDAGAQHAVRFAAIDRWRTWWATEGAAAFARDHPELADFVVPPPASSEEIEAALWRGFAPVPSLEAINAVFRVPTTSARALLASGTLLASRSVFAGVEFSFTSLDAESDWFDQASVSADGTLSAVAIHNAKNWVDSRGRLWFMARLGDGLLQRFDGRFETIAEQHYDDARVGDNGAYFAIDNQWAVHLFDDRGHLTAKTFAELVTTDSARVRNAIGRRMEQPTGYQRFLFARDSADRIWWWSPNEGVVVWDGERVVRGAVPKLQERTPARRRIDAFAPLPDGGVLALSGERSGALLTLRDGKVVTGDTLWMPQFVSPFPSVLYQADGAPLVAGRRLPERLGQVRVPGAWMRQERGQLIAAVGPAGVTWRVERSSSRQGGSVTRVGRGGGETELTFPRGTHVQGVLADGSDAAWVLVKDALLRVQRDGRKLEQTHRAPIATDSSCVLAHGGPGRVWVVPIDHRDLPATCFLLRAR